MDDEAATHASTLDASMARARTITLIVAHNAAFRGFYLAARQPRIEAAPRLDVRRRRQRRPRLPGEPVSQARSASCASSTAADRRTPASCTESAPRSRTSRPTRPATRSSPPPSPCAPDRSSSRSPTCRPTRTTGSSATPRRSRSESAAPLGGHRALRAVRRELPPRAARRRRRVRHPTGRRPQRPRDHRQLAAPEGRGAARRPR